MRDDRFIEDVKKSGLDFNPLDGEALQAIIEKSLKISPAVIDAAKSLTKGSE
jgi:hypothetical protein